MTSFIRREAYDVYLGSTKGAEWGAASVFIVNHPENGSKKLLRNGGTYPPNGITSHPL